MTEGMMWKGENMNSESPSSSAITWFYYKELGQAAEFYGETMGFELVVNQVWTRIYRANEGAFLGIVAGENGFCQPQERNAVLFTLVVKDVAPWFDRLKARGADLLTEIEEKEDIQVRCFFLKDPGGYSIEVQQFLDPAVSQHFVS